MLAKPCRRLFQEPLHGIIQLDDVDARRGQPPELLADHRNEGPSEIGPLQVCRRGVLRVPQVARQRRRCRQRHEGTHGRMALEILSLGGRDGPPPGDAADDHGQERGSARYPPILTAVDTVSHDGREVAAAPLTVGNDIETGSLLHTDGADDRLIHAGCRFGSAQGAGSLLLHHVEQPARPRQTADDVGLQELGRYRLCSRSVRVTGRRHCQAPAQPGHRPSPAGGRS